MGCQLTSCITKDKCAYSVAGIKSLYLINFDTETKYDFDTTDVNKTKVKGITLASGAKAYKIEFISNTASFSDELAENGNGGKYRTHTLNFSLDKYDYDLLNQGDALSLGRFTAVVADKSNRVIILGRLNGLNSTAFNYASGAADADATGWTVTMAGTETEIAPLLENEDLIKSLVECSPVVTP